MAYDACRRVFVDAKLSGEAKQYLEAEGLRTSADFEGADWAFLPSGDKRFLQWSSHRGEGPRLLSCEILEEVANTKELNSFTGKWTLSSLPHSDFPLSSHALVRYHSPKNMYYMFTSTVATYRLLCVVATRHPLNP